MNSAFLSFLFISAAVCGHQHLVLTARGSGWWIIDRITFAPAIVEEGKVEDLPVMTIFESQAVKKWGFFTDYIQDIKDLKITVKTTIHGFNQFGNIQVPPGIKADPTPAAKALQEKLDQKFGDNIRIEKGANGEQLVLTIAPTLDHKGTLLFGHIMTDWFCSDKIVEGIEIQNFTLDKTEKQQFSLDLHLKCGSTSVDVTKGQLWAPVNDFFDFLDREKNGYIPVEKARRLVL